jgi:hypothetical protein
MKDLAAPLASAGVRVINCSPDSAVECFQKMDLDAALALSIGPS